ncbi:MAG: Gfo/Idh/MocA family oxidoreductase [Bacteroidota bacterium]
MKLTVSIIGGGMITNDLILPAVYHLQRKGDVDQINVCALNSAPLKDLKDNLELKEVFPGQDFHAYPNENEPAEKIQEELYKEVLQKMDPRNVVIIALPDQLHYSAVKEALHAGQHVLCVKPLVLKYEEAKELEELAYSKGLFVGVEYHKRFDRRARLARKNYLAGKVGEFKIGEAKMIEPYYYRYSNFQNWFTTDKTDPFVYVGCHYVDLVYFITGLRPVEVSVQGVKGKFPNGNEGYMWANGRVRFENDALLNVTDGLGYPDDAAGFNDQCLVMYCEGDGKAGMIKQNDQFRGVTHSFVEGAGPANKYFGYYNPDFFQLVPWNGEGLEPIGYGVESVQATILQALSIETEVAGMNEAESLKRRQEIIKEVDERGILATPANSYINELVVEAARLSITNDGDRVVIIYGDNPHVELHEHIPRSLMRD